MAILESVEDLKNYCLRKLGSPVINIEIDDTQTYDRIQDALEYFAERHYNGVEEAYYKYVVRHIDVERGYITVPEEFVAIIDILSKNQTTSAEAMADVQYQFMMENYRQLMRAELSEYYLGQQHIALLNNLFTPERSFTFNSASHRLTPRWKLSDVGGANLLLDADDITTANWTAINAVLTSNSTTDPLGTQKAHTVESGASGGYGLEQTYSTDRYVRGVITGWVSLKAGTYTGQVKLTLKDSAGTIVGAKTVNLTNRWEGEYITATYAAGHVDDITFTIEAATPAGAAGENFHIYNPNLYQNSMLILHGYKALDPEEATNIYNDRWVKEYATALIKRQWGTNIKKFEGIQLPGGMTMNGQQIFDEAQTEIERLEEKFSLEYELPIDMMIG